MTQQDVTVGGVPVVLGVKVRMTAAELATHLRARADEKPELKEV